MLATVVKKSWIGGAFALDVVTTAMTYHILPFPIQMYSLFALAMDAFVCVREFIFDRNPSMSYGTGFSQVRGVLV